MKSLLIIAAFIVSVIWWNSQAASDKPEAINPLTGDVSFVNKFGRLPTAATDENLRIKTHLEYVEKLLRKKDVSHLQPELQQKRKHLLDLLHTYRTSGNFPKNFDFKDRRVPCFIDKDGTICAVGYLVEQTAGRETAEAINAGHKYDRLLAMNDPLVDNWVATSGLSKEECAMIQPTYGPNPGYNSNYISPAYGISSAVLGGLNLSLNTINAIYINKGTNNKNLPVIGIITGAGSIVYGAANFPNEEKSIYFGNSPTNESRKALSIVNIGIGTSTMILSIWNLAANRQKKDKAAAWNIYSYPAGGNQTGIGVPYKGLVKQI